MIMYLAAYEQRYHFLIVRPVRVTAIRRTGAYLQIEGGGGTYLTQAVVSATGTWSKPFIPPYPGRERFGGTQLHSAQYRSPELFRNQVVLIIGGGNSGAQFLAEVGQVAEAFWVTAQKPRFLPDTVDGRVLFQ